MDVQYRRFNLQITAVVHDAPDDAHDPRARTERGAYLGVDDHIHIALAVPKIGILEAMELLGQRQQRLGKQRDRGCFDGNFTRVGLEYFAFRADDVADVRFF